MAGYYSFEWMVISSRILYFVRRSEEGCGDFGYTFYFFFIPHSRQPLVLFHLSSAPSPWFSSISKTHVVTPWRCLSHPQTPTFLPPARKLILPGDESLVPRNKNWQENRIVVSCSIVVSDLVLSLACSSILAMGFFLRRLGLPRNKESKMRRDGYSE